MGAVLMSATANQTEDEEVHERLLYDGPNIDPVDFVADVRRRFREMPRTKSTFLLSDITNGNYNKKVIPHLMEFAGSWHVPEPYAPQKGKMYANPHGVHAHTFPTIKTKCRCGTRMLTVHPGKKETRMATNASDHNDNCLPHWKHRACARLLEKRREILQIRGRWGYPQEDTMPMLGCKRSSRSIVNRLGVDYGELRSEARQRTANTAAKLMKEKPTIEIAEAYGYSARHLKALVKELTPHSPQELYLERRRSTEGEQ